MATPHDGFADLSTSWRLALRADGYSPNTITSYARALRSLAAWLAAAHPGVGPTGLTREHIRGWIVHLRTVASGATARSWFAGVRHFTRWALAEREIDVDPTDGIRTPTAGESRTDLVSADDIRALMATCAGRSFVDRRDAAIILVLVDGGLRLAELAGLALTDVDLPSRMLWVQGKGTNRSGPRRRAVPLGVVATRALDRYIRERKRHPHAGAARLWLGALDRPALGGDGITRMLARRSRQAGVTGIHAHRFRHSWADAFRTAGGSEGDLMVLGGWRNRQMLDRYGRSGAENRARDAGHRLSYADRL